MGVQIDVSKEGFAGRLEVIVGRTGRRVRSDDEKARIAAESLMPRRRVTDVSRRHFVTRWQVYDWRRRGSGWPLALPESVVSAPALAALVVGEPAPPMHGKTTEIEIVVGDVVVRAGPGHR